MIIHVTMKTPDAMSDAIDEAVDNLEIPKNTDSEDYLYHHRQLAEKLLEKYFKWDEYLEIEFDTDKMTAVVLPN